MPADRKMRRGDFECLYSDKVACSKWLDKRSVMLKEWQQHLLFPTGKKDQRQKSKYLAQTLSK